MQLDKLTIKAQAALQEAQQIAHRYSHQELDGEHLLLALVDQADSLIPELLQKLGVTVPKLKADVETELAQRPKVQGAGSTDVFLGPSLKKAFDAAVQFLAGFLIDPDNPAWLQNLSATYENLGVQPNPIMASGTSFSLNRNVPLVPEQLNEAAALLSRKS